MMRIFLSVLVIASFISGCSRLAPSYGEKMSRKIAGDYVEGDFVSNVCHVSLPQQKEQCLNGPYMRGQIPKAGCGSPWIYYVLGAKDLESHTVEVKAVMTDAAVASESSYLPIKVNEKCVVPYLSDRDQMISLLNLENLLSTDLWTSAREPEKASTWLVCGVALGQGLAYGVVFPNRCVASQMEVRSLSGLRFAVTTAHGFELGSQVRIIVEGENQHANCAQGTVKQIHQILSLSSGPAHFEFQVTCSDDEIWMNEDQIVSI